MPSVTSNICFMCLSEKTDSNKFQLKLVQDDMLNKAAFVLPDLPISRQMCPQYVCNVCYKRIIYFYKFKKMCNRNYTRWIYYMTKLGEKTNLKQMQEMKIIVYKPGPPPEESESAESSSDEDSDEEVTQLRNKLNPQNSELNKNTTQVVNIENTADSSSTNVQSIPEYTITVQVKNSAQNEENVQNPNNIETSNSVDNSEIPEKSGIHITKCTICNKQFFTQMALQYHLNLIHNMKNVEENTSVANSVEKLVNSKNSETPNKLISLLKMSTEENTTRKALDIVKICEKIKKEIITSKIDNQEVTSLATPETSTTDFKIENVRSLHEVRQSTPKNNRNEENSSSDEDWAPEEWVAPIQPVSKRFALRSSTSKNYQENAEDEDGERILKRGRGRPRKKTTDVQRNISKGKLMMDILDNYIKTDHRPESEKSEILPQPENKIDTLEKPNTDEDSNSNETKNNSSIKRRRGRPKIMKLSSDTDDITDNKLAKNDKQLTGEEISNLTTKISQDEQKTQKDTNTNISNSEQKKNIHIHCVQTFASPNVSNDIENKVENSPAVQKNISSTSKAEEIAVKITESIEKFQTKLKSKLLQTPDDVFVDTDVTTSTPLNKMAAETDDTNKLRRSTRILSIDDASDTSTNKMAADNMDEENKKPLRLKNKRKLISTSSEDSDDSIEPDKMAAELNEKDKNNSFDSPEILRPKRIHKRKLSTSSEDSICSDKNGDRNLETINKMAAENLPNMENKNDENCYIGTENVQLSVSNNKTEPENKSDVLENDERPKPSEIVTNVGNVQKKARPKSKQKKSSNTENIKLDIEKINIQRKARPKSKQKKTETNPEIKDVQKPKIIKTRTCEICDEIFNGKLILENHLRSVHYVEITLSDSEEEIRSSDDEKKSSNILDDGVKNIYKPMPKSKRKHIKNDDKIVTPDDKDNKDDTQDDDNSADELLNNIQELIDETSNKSPETTSKLRDRKSHMRRRDDIPKRYQCNVCKKKFLYASLLTTHLKRVHLKLRKPCPVCQKALTDTYSILLHMEKFHNDVEVNFAISEQSTDKSDDTNDDSGDDFDGEPPEDLEKNPHVEKMLSMKLELAKQKKMLMIEAKKKVDDFVCNICNKICSNKLALVSHIKSHKIILKV